MSFSCTHAGKKPVKTLDGVTLYAAAKWDLKDYEDFDLIVNLTGTAIAGLGNQALVSGKERWSRLNDLCKVNGHVEEVVLDWKDGDDWPGDHDFWIEFWKELKSTSPKKVAFCCFGAHGRTGTALSSLLVTIGSMTAKDAVSLVRKKHCESAVESHAQIDYLVFLERGEWPAKDEDVGIEPPKKKWTGYTGGYGDNLTSAYGGYTAWYLCYLCNTYDKGGVEVLGKDLCEQCVVETRDKIQFKKGLDANGRIKLLKKALENKIRARAKSKGHTISEDATATSGAGLDWYLTKKDQKEQAAGQGSLECQVCGGYANALLVLTVDAKTNDKIKVCRDCEDQTKALISWGKHREGQ